MLWRPQTRTIVFQGKQEAEWGYSIADLYVPAAPPAILISEEKHDIWCSGGWEKEPHGCICKRVNGECHPDANPFQGILLKEEKSGTIVSRVKLIRLIAPSVHWVIFFQPTICHDMSCSKLWIDEFSIEFRIGELFPEYLEIEANGCLSL
ncbi:MAG TPA: hypothetical protein VGA53_02380 [Candidatus Paceibacterota bacterium]